MTAPDLLAEINASIEYHTRRGAQAADRGWWGDWEQHNAAVEQQVARRDAHDRRKAIARQHAQMAQAVEDSDEARRCDRDGMHGDAAEFRAKARAARREANANLRDAGHLTPVRSDTQARAKAVAA